MSCFLIRHIEALALVMHRRWLIHLAQGRRFAVRADGLRSIIEALPELELGVAAVAVVSVERHKLRLPVSGRNLALRRADFAGRNLAGRQFRFEYGGGLAP